MDNPELSPQLSQEARQDIEDRFRRTSGVVARGLRIKGQHGYYSHARKKLDSSLVSEIRRTARYIQDDPSAGDTGLTHRSYGIECGLVVGGLFGQTMLDTRQMPHFSCNMRQNLQAIRSVPRHESPYDICDFVARRGAYYAQQFYHVVGDGALSLAEIYDNDNEEQDDVLQTTYENAFGYVCAEAVSIAMIDALRQESHLAGRERRQLEAQADVFERIDQITTAHVAWLQDSD